MMLRIVLPEREVLSTEVERIVVHGADGSFCLLPRHRDIVSALVPGILTFSTGGHEKHAAVDEGVLVKCGTDVTVATRQAVIGHPLGELRDAIDERFLDLSEEERRTRAALGRLEADLVREVLSWEHR